MRMCTIVILAVLCISMLGCNESAKKSEPELDKRLINTELINSYNDLAMQNAIISQHTLYPYHFVNNSAELNELGQRDFAVLAEHFKKNPGQLNVRHDGVPSDTYEARAKVVFEGLKEAGIDVKRITMSDGMPGGSGVTSERLLTILAAADGAGDKKTTTTHTTGVENCLT